MDAREGHCAVTSRVEAAGVLVALLLTAVTHVGVELRWGTADMFGPQHGVSILAVAGWGLYVAHRIARVPGVLDAWGLTLAHLERSVFPSLCIALVGTIVLLAYGRMQERLPLPITFWVTWFFYPVWGLVQQFALQVLFHRSLRIVTGARSWTILMTATVFALAHYPQWTLMLLTFTLGTVLSWTWIYRSPNLWPLGIVHGWLGALAYYLVLGLDPCSVLMRCGA